MNEIRTKYQGWSNYETWFAYTWLSNDEYGAELLRKAKWELGDSCERGQWLCDQYEESLFRALNHDNIFGEASFLHDFIQSVFDRINWTEIMLLS